MKKELLVPAGNMECLKQAVMNGCDAVYLACKNFGARKFAANFTNEEIVEAIQYCHLYGVKVYVTMNTLVKNEEVDDFLKQASFLHQQGVDALIVQDFGMICLLREKYPNLEIHASTQANISSYEVCQLYHSLGVKRVVFARELSIDEINNIDVPIEKEVFIHGALCISYSGCCLMSSMIGGRSGNRGECAGVCRMPFSLYNQNELIENNKYLLSTKELNTTSYIKQLLNSNIDSFKIEGRMKSPLYVGFITHLYRRLIDNESINLEEEINRLKTIFNREFTKGRLFYENDQNIMNTKSPNHIGLEIGKVIAILKDKIKIELKPSCTLHQGDAIRFNHSQEGFIVNYLYDEKDNLISSSSGICMVDNKIHLNELDTISKTQDSQLEKEYSSRKEKKLPIHFDISFVVGKPLKAIIQDDLFCITEENEIVQEAINSPLKEEDIIRQFNKLGDTPFMCNDYTIQMDQNGFLPISCLNEIRRSLTNQLMIARMNHKKEFKEENIIFEKEVNSINNKKNEIHCHIVSKEQLEACLEKAVDKIYTANEELYKEYQNYENVYYEIPRCLYHIKESLKERNVVSDYALYNQYSNIGNYGLNVTNIYTAYYLSKIGVKTVCLSPELNKNDYDAFLKQYTLKFGDKPFIILNYGRVENMIIKGNILHLKENIFTYYLMDSNKRKYPVFFDGRLTHILHHEKKKENYSKNYILRFDFFEETKKEVEEILKEID